MSAPMTQGLLEVIDRDGFARQSLTVRQWPVRIGRALDNDLVLGDPHVAAYHAAIEPVDGELRLEVGETRNGVQIGRQRLRRGEQAVLSADGQPPDLMLGRTHLRLRLPGHALAPEVSTVADGPLLRRVGPLFLAAVLLVLGTLLASWLQVDPDGDLQAVGRDVLVRLLEATAWCTVWALLSKTFTRQARFGWHVKVLVWAGLAMMLSLNLLQLLAFAFSWPALSAYDFIAVIGVAAVALYFHLLAVEPNRRQGLKWAATSCAVVGVLLSMWFNYQASGHLGDELYMSHLYPPGLRLARPAPAAAFVDGFSALKAPLDAKAKQPGDGDDAGTAAASEE